MTVADCARTATTALLDAGLTPEDARRDVAVLIRHVIGWDTAAWLTRQRDPAPAGLPAGLDPLIARRAAGEPVAYLLGMREFYGRPFEVTRDVLVPRPETELLVERALGAVDALSAAHHPLVVVDVGTGSGCIAVTLAHERPAVRVIATDTSAAALDVAAANARRHGVANRVTLVHGDLTAGARAADVIVSNPPYIPWPDRDRLMRDVRDFEPASALFAGDDGLDVIRRLVPDAMQALRPGGRLAIEIGSGQGDAVRSILIAAGLEAVDAHPDLAGIPRVVEGRRPGGSV